MYSFFSTQLAMFDLHSMLFLHFRMELLSSMLVQMQKEHNKDVCKSYNLHIPVVTKYLRIQSTMLLIEQQNFLQLPRDQTSIYNTYNKMMKDNTYFLPSSFQKPGSLKISLAKILASSLFFGNS